ncbi:MAG: 4Fe-4S ferredoxin [Clostridiales bacterium]|nr:4Fe-4S ferredoxin [Clostridiales bacterium]
MIIADGLKGTDEALVPIQGDYVKEAKIGRAIMDADIFISLTHFKGHESTGFGGALKNIGMGCGSRAGKMEMHNSGKPNVDTDYCKSCGVCIKNCAHSAITFNENNKAGIDHNLCVGCGRCIGACNYDAVNPWGDQANDLLNYKIAEYTYAVVKERPHFHISLVVDVSPNCDCHSENDVPLVPNVGMFASFDPVALDVACADAVNGQPIISNSALARMKHTHNDHFTNLHPDTNWKSCIDHAVKIGLGNKEYELITIK